MKEFTEEEMAKLKKSAIETIIFDVHKTAVEKKWWEPGPTFPEALMLVVSELSEALEKYRQHDPVEIFNYEGTKPEGIPIELADAVIRIFDLAEGFNVPLAEAVMVKMAYNKTRPERHGGKKL